LSTPPEPPGTQLEILESVIDDIIRLELVGEVDMTNAEQISARVRSRLDAGATRVVIDLARLQFLDSRGLQNLVACRQYGDLVRKPVHIVGAHGRIAGIIEVTGMTHYLIDSSPAPALHRNVPETDASPA
jgi:anti-anti-sigma factor